VDAFVESRHVQVKRDSNRVIVTIDGKWSDLWPLYLPLVTLIAVPLYVDKRVFGRAELPLLLLFLAAGAWRKFLRETVELSAKRLVISKKLSGSGPTEFFDLDKVCSFRYNKFFKQYLSSKVLFDVEYGFRGGFGYPSIAMKH